jgi:hypothetical protein
MEINVQYFDESSKYDGAPLMGNYIRPIEKKTRVFKPKKEWTRI